MRGRFALFGATVLFLLVLPTRGDAASTVIVNFNSLPSASYPVYTEGVVTFLPSFLGGTFSASGTPNGTQGLLGDGSPRTAIRANIAGGTNFVSVDLGDFDVDDDLAYLQAFNSANVSLGMSTLPISAADSTMHTLSVSFPNIDHVEFGGKPPSLNGASLYSDNFTYAVPEPTAAALLMMAVTALLGARMRRWHRPARPAIPRKSKSDLRSSAAYRPSQSRMPLSR